MPEVLLAGRPVPYILVRNPRSRHVRMTFTRDGLRVSAPVRLPEAEVDRAVRSKERWLLRHADLLDPVAPTPLEDGALVPFLDGVVELGLRKAPRASITFRPEEGRLAIAVPDGADVGVLVERAYRTAARDWFRRACADHTASMGVSPGAIGIRDPTTRWGSCSARGTVSFSWRLLMAPARVADYVVVHELAHLVHMDHSPAFWSVVARECPDHETASAWLRVHGRWLARAPGHGPRPGDPPSI